MARKIIILFAAVIMQISSQTLLSAGTKIDILSWEELSDTDISPVGKVALSLDKDPWNHAQTEHFIYHFTDVKAFETVYIHAEIYYEWIKNFFGVAEDSWKKKSHIFVFADKKIWDDFKARVGQGSKANAFTNHWELFMYREALWTSPRRSLAHELTHVILFRFAEGPVPLFLNEGFACFAASQLLKMQLEANNYEQAPLKQLSASEYVPIDAIARMSEYPAENVDAFYSEAEWFVKFIVFTYGKDKFCDILMAASRGEGIGASAENACGIDLEGLENKFKSFALSKG